MPRIFYSAFVADANFFAVDPRIAQTPGAGKLPWLLAVDDSTNLVAAVKAAKASGATLPIGPARRAERGGGPRGHAPATE